MKQFSIFVDAQESLQFLSQTEVVELLENKIKKHDFFDLFKNCALAVLHCGKKKRGEMIKNDQNFEIDILQQVKGIQLKLSNIPKEALVDNLLIEGVKEFLFSVLRDLFYFYSKLKQRTQFHLKDSANITNFVFHFLRNANFFKPQTTSPIITCWGGSLINLEEYNYCKLVGYELGIRKFNICTGCGPGSMKGPMKGASIAHVKQRIKTGRYIGISEIAIITEEPPNPIVNELIVMPDIEKRLEAFVRVGHGFIVFPGGVGTLEELLYLLVIRLSPKNKNISFPLILTGPSSSKDYFKSIENFLEKMFGQEIKQYYQVIVGDAEEVSYKIKKEINQTLEFRKSNEDSFSFNWSLYVPYGLQETFHPSYDEIEKIFIHSKQNKMELAIDLRKIISSIVAGNVKRNFVKIISEKGPFKIKGEKTYLLAINEILEMFTLQKRMPTQNKTLSYQFVF